MELIKADREYLKVRMEADAICQKNDLEKMEKEKQGKLALRDYHKKQIVSHLKKIFISIFAGVY